MDRGLPEKILTLFTFFFRESYFLSFTKLIPTLICTDLLTVF